MEQKKIETLTKVQEAKIPEYRSKYLEIGMSTKPCNREAAEKAITASYLYQKKAPPKFIWADSPKAGIILAAQLAKGSEDATKEEIKTQLSKASFGSFDSYWVSFYAFIVEQLPVKHDDLFSIVKNIVENCGVYWSFEGVVVITERPTAIHMKNEKLHNTSGPALAYKDGFGVVALNGIRYKSLISLAIENASNDQTRTD